MILILENGFSVLGAALEQASARRGMETLRLTPERIVRDIGVEFYLDSRGCSGSLAADGRSVPLADVKGVYCSIDRFSPSLWPDFSARDANYAAAETQAIWLALLSSLACRSVNPASPDALGGPVYSPTEVFSAARLFALSISAIACLSLSEAMAMSREPLSASVCDLGKEQQPELSFDGMKESRDVSSQRQVRLRERLPGARIVVCMVAESVFVSTGTAATDKPRALDCGSVPSDLLEGLRALHLRLGLVLAEYRFVKQADREWILDDIARAPGEQTWAVHAESLVSAILDSMMTTKGAA